ncbi:hypothetical protein [Rhodococcus sp. IEGM 1408]|nr:hypothetical protein [Rhodococcus sp. IEGM 1408]MDV8001596.1 hypothetical protein [Rhodococcus sp. IEGM 1408]
MPDFSAIAKLLGGAKDILDFVAGITGSVGGFETGVTGPIEGLLSGSAE